MLYFDMLIWISVFWLLKIIFVSVLVSFVLLILVGLRNRKVVVGLELLCRFVCVSCIVLVMVWIVFFWLMMCLCSFFLSLRSLFFFLVVRFVIGMLVILEMICVM